MEVVYRFFQDYSLKKKIMPRAKFFPYWNEKEGMTFVVVMDKCFKNTLETKEAISRLPRPIAVKAQIISHWDANTVFFNRQVFSRQ